MEKKPQRTPEELWKTLEEQAANDELDRIAALSEAELDAEIRADGGDPEAIGERGRAFVERLFKQREENAAAAAKLAAVRARFEEVKRRPREKLPRAELEKRVEAARRDPRFAQPVTVMFRNRTTAEATDEELEALLVQIEALAEHEE